MSRILLVEDDKNISKNLSELLASEDYQVTAVATQKAALEKLEEIKSEKFDLLLLDISLPEGNGYAVCTAAKRNTDMPVIFLTASDDEASVVTGLELGADDYIIKP